MKIFTKMRKRLTQKYKVSLKKMFLINKFIKLNKKWPHWPNNAMKSSQKKSKLKKWYSWSTKK